MKVNTSHNLAAEQMYTHEAGARRKTDDHHGGERNRSEHSVYCMFLFSLAQSCPLSRLSLLHSSSSSPLLGGCTTYLLEQSHSSCTSAVTLLLQQQLIGQPQLHFYPLSWTLTCFFLPAGRDSLYLFLTQFSP